MARTKRALVLGCGAVAGAAWTIATLDAVERHLAWDAREADVIVGTSAGAMLAALLAAGVGVDRLMACQRGDAPDCIWDHDRDSGGAWPRVPALGFTGVGLALGGLLGRVAPVTAVCGLLPVGRADMTPFMRLIDSVVPAGGWAPHPAAWMMVVDAANGRRVALGRHDAPAAPLNLAVCASYAVPACCPPVEIGERRYIDGGVASPTSADFLLDSDVTEAVVLAPMCASVMDRPASPLAWIERRLRRHMTLIVDREVAALRQAGIRVIRLEPGPEDLTAIGYNMLDPGRRRLVFDTALRTAAASLN